MYMCARVIWYMCNVFHTKSTRDANSHARAHQKRMFTILHILEMPRVTHTHTLNIHSLWQLGLQHLLLPHRQRHDLVSRGNLYVWYVYAALSRVCEIGFRECTLINSFVVRVLMRDVLLCAGAASSFRALAIHISSSSIYTHKHPHVLRRQTPSPLRTDPHTQNAAAEDANAERTKLERWWQRLSGIGKSNQYQHSSTRHETTIAITHRKQVLTLSTASAVELKSATIKTSTIYIVYRAVHMPSCTCTYTYST